MKMTSRHHQSRLLSLCIYCAATLGGLSSVDAFSLVQNASASQQFDSSGSSSDAGAGARPATNNNGARASRSAAASASATASVNNVNNPFRGSLNGRRPRRQPSDDFALRMGMQSDLEHELLDSENNDISIEIQSREGGESQSRPSKNNCDSESVQNSNINGNGKQSTDTDEEDQQQQQLYERRKFLHGMLATTTTLAAISSVVAVEQPQPANAYEQAYPLELKSTPFNEVENSSNSLSKLKEERLIQKKAKVAATQSELRTDPLGLNQSPFSNNFGLTIAGASTWALALWFATGSRSNPIVTPLANVVYDEGKEDWLSDRNEGYFGELPVSFMAILSAVFVFLGVVLDRAVYFLADGDAEVSLQLAGVSLIGGAVWEVGRLAAKEKAPTREEYERDVVLYQEFEEFANKRLIVGRGSCHRSDVISAFRRYNPKYRVADNEQFPLVDIEIERILRVWNREFGSKSEMSSAGFFSGITVDGGADVSSVF